MIWVEARETDVWSSKASVPLQMGCGCQIGNEWVLVLNMHWNQHVGPGLNHGFHSRTTEMCRMSLVSLVQPAFTLQDSNGQPQWNLTTFNTMVRVVMQDLRVVGANVLLCSLTFAELKRNPGAWISYRIEKLSASRHMCVAGCARECHAWMLLHDLMSSECVTVQCSICGVLINRSVHLDDIVSVCCLVVRD